MFLYISIKDPFKSTQYTSFATAYASFCHQFFLEAPFISRITSCLTVNNNTYINSLFSKFWAFSQEATSLRGNKTSYTHVNHGWYKLPAKKLFFFFHIPSHNLLLFVPCIVINSNSLDETMDHIFFSLQIHSYTLCWKSPPSFMQLCTPFGTLCCSIHVFNSWLIYPFISSNLETKFKPFNSIRSTKDPLLVPRLACYINLIFNVWEQ